MGMPESLQRIPPGVSIALIVVLIIGLGIFVYGQFAASEPEVEIAEAGTMTTLKCTRCGHTLERETAELQRLSPNPTGRIELTSETAKCPECGESALDVVQIGGQ